jgi:hypothetical protein
MRFVRPFLHFVISVSALLVTMVSNARSTGSPVCTVDTATMNANMGVRTGTNPNGWALDVSAVTYSPGGSAFGVRLTNVTPSVQYKGILLWATDSAGNQVGTWASAGSSFQTPCSGQSLTHTSSQLKASPSPFFQLSLPITVRGAVTIRAFVVQESRTTHYEMTTTHVHLDPVRNDLDIDSSVSVSRYQANTDGLLVLRYLLGLRGNELTLGAKNVAALRTDAEIATQLAHLQSSGLLDIDGDGQTRPETDGLLILRYLIGYRNNVLVEGANAGTLTPAQIAAKIAALLP